LDEWVLEDKACSACVGSLIHALKRLSDRRELGRAKQRISVGQGFLDKSGEGLGIGDCTLGLNRCVAGCPPTAQSIVEYIRKTK
jgi:hypothetical protein